MHPAFRNGFEKTADMQSLYNQATHPIRHPNIAAQRAWGKMKTIGRDMASGVGIGKGIVPKVFGLMTVGDIVSKTRSAMTKPGQLGVSRSFFTGAPA